MDKDRYLPLETSTDDNALEEAIADTMHALNCSYDEACAFMRSGMDASKYYGCAVMYDFHLQRWVPKRTH
jgi:hypothetical protein